jgi:hypothetical protein
MLKSAYRQGNSVVSHSPLSARRTAPSDSRAPPMPVANEGRGLVGEPSFDTVLLILWFR